MQNQLELSYFLEKRLLSLPMEKIYDAFLSYHWRDHAHVEAIARALRERDLNVFLDRWYLHPGRPWPQELEKVMRSCKAVAVFVGPGEMGPWQQREMNMALERQAKQSDFPVICGPFRRVGPA